MKLRKLSRKNFLKLSAGTILSLGLWPGCKLEAESASENFSFAVLNDLHCLSDECAHWLEKVASDVKQRAPQFCVIAGDLTDKAEPKYMDMVRSVFSSIGCSLHVQIGNHDYLSDTDRSSFNQIFPDSLNYQFEQGGWQFIALDTSQGQKSENTIIGTDTFSWLDSNLPKLSKTKPTVIFTHFPLAQQNKLHPSNSNALLARFLD